MLKTRTITYTGSLNKNIEFIYDALRYKVSSDLYSISLDEMGFKLYLDGCGMMIINDMEFTITEYGDKITLIYKFLNLVNDSISYYVPNVYKIVKNHIIPDICHTIMKEISIVKINEMKMLILTYYIDKKYVEQFWYNSLKKINDIAIKGKKTDNPILIVKSYSNLEKCRAILRNITIL